MSKILRVSIIFSLWFIATHSFAASVSSSSVLVRAWLASTGMDRFFTDVYVEERTSNARASKIIHLELTDVPAEKVFRITPCSSALFKNYAEERFLAKFATLLNVDFNNILISINENGKSHLIDYKLINNIEKSFLTAALMSRGFRSNSDNNTSINAVVKPVTAGKLRGESNLCSALSEEVRLLQNLDFGTIAANSALVKKCTSRENIVAFFREFAEREHASLQRKKISDSFVQISMAGLHGRVVKGSSLWEYLDIIVVLQKTAKDIVGRCILDGRFTAGLLTPKTQYEYDTPMEPKYSSELMALAEEICDDMATKIRERCERSSHAGDNR